MSRIRSSLLLSALLELAGCQRAVQTPAAAAPVAPAVLASATSAAAPERAAQPAAKPARPRLVLQTFAGEQFDLQALRGKWVVVNFWATWCNPCLKEIPDLDAFDKARADVTVIGLAYEEIEPADMQAFLKQHPVSYPVALMDVYKGLPDFPIPKGLPMTYVIAPDGKVAKQFLGPVDMQVLAGLVGTPTHAAASGEP